MDKLLKQQEIAKRNNDFKRNSNRLLKTFLFIFVLGYAFFFTSSLWMPAKAQNINVTKLGSSIEANDRSVTPLVWILSENDKKMEVIIEIQNTALDGIDQYKWTALDRNKGFFDVKEIINTPEFVVLQVENVKKGWTEISLRMDVDEKILGNREFTTVKMYAAKKSINKVSRIETGSYTDYQRIAISSKIKKARADIKSLQEEITNQKTIVAAGKKRIAELKYDMNYQTKDEQESTTESIIGIDTEISSAKDKVDECNEKISQAKEKIKLQGKKAAKL